MNSRQILKSSLLSIFLLVSTWSQGAIDTTAAAMLEVKKTIDQGFYINVIQDLTPVINKYPATKTANGYLGEAYFKARNYRKACVHFAVAYSAPKVFEARWFIPYAQAAWQSGNPKLSLDILSQFEKRKEAGQGTNRTLVRQMKDQVVKSSLLDTLPQWYEFDTTFRFPNSGYADFSPVKMNDSTFLFSSLRLDTIMSYQPEEANFNNIRIYAYSTSDVSFNRITAVKSLNVQGMEVANGSFTPDMAYFYFTRCRENKDGGLDCSIFVAEHSNGKFKNIKKLDEQINGKGTYNGQPCVITNVVKNQQIPTLYFVSNRKGSLGSKDIWVSTYNLKKKKFGPAANLGRNINTASDEVSPYFDAVNNVLYFSSAGHPGYGGLDVFAAKMAGNRFGEAVNQARPLNSPFDDHYFYIERSGNVGYLSSNRKESRELTEGICCEDVFKIRRLPTAKKPDTSVVNKALELANLLSKAASVPLVAEDKTEKVVKMVNTKEAITKNDSKGIDARSTRLLQSISQNTRFETNSDQLLDYSKDYLDTLCVYLKENPALQVKLTGHTDNKGSEELNLQLSRQRAESVKAFIVSNSISDKRIKVAGMGPRQPLYPNTNPDGSDNSDNRAKNRRVTIEILKK